MYEKSISRIALKPRMILPGITSVSLSVPGTKLFYLLFHASRDITVIYVKR